MGRASFGGAADYSGVFAGLYNQAASERKSQIDNAMNEAKRVAQAEDESLIEAWKKGSVSDAELLGRLAMRRDEAMDDVDKSAFASLYNEYKEAIADGKATVKFANNPSGLINYYQQKLKGLNPNSAGYRRAQLEIINIKKTLTPDTDGRKNTPALLAKIDAFVGDETDYKLLLVKAYEGGMNTWPPSTSHGLTQAEVEVLTDGAETYDVPTGDSITPEYIDGIDAEIIQAIDLAIVGAPAGAKVKYNKLKADYLANHVSLHNDYQQQQILTDPNGGVLATSFAAMTDAAKGTTDPKDMMSELKTVRDTLAAHFTAAGNTVVTNENQSGGATSNEYQIFGNKMVAIIDDMIAGKYGAAKAVDLLSATVKGFPDYKDNWVQMAFNDDALKAMFLGTDDEPSGFTKLEYFAQGYKGVTGKPPTRAFVYDYEDGVGFVPVREVTTMVNGKPVKKYEPVLPVPQPKSDGNTDAWTMVSMDVNGVPTLVPALATLQTTGLPMAVFNKDGVMLTDENAIFKFAGTLPPGDITKYIRPAVAVYTVNVGTGDAATSYSYVGGQLSANGTLAGGTWVPSDKVTELYGGKAYTTKDPKLGALLNNAGIVLFQDPTKPYKADGVVAGEPIVYLGDNQAIFRAVLNGRIPDPNGILVEAERHGIGLNEGAIDPFDADQVDVWAEGYDGMGSAGGPGRTGFGGVGGRRRPGAPGSPASSEPKGGLGTTEKWNDASERKAVFRYDQAYMAYDNLPAKKDDTDPIANILGGPEEEEPFRYAPRVPGNAFSPGAVSEYAAMAQERDRNILPRISIADSWDRGIKTLPTAPTPPAPTSPTPPPPSSPTPTGPRPPTPPRGPSAAGPVKL